MDDGFKRIVLLNSLVSRSVARASAEHKPPIMSGTELLDIIEKRRAKGLAIEYIGLANTDQEDDKDEAKRAKRGIGHDFLLLRQMRTVDGGEHRYAHLLFEFVDQSKRSFSVVDVLKLTGREISAEADERGCVSAHIIVRLPAKESYQDGSYRCAIEVAPKITRGEVERFLCRQLRRQATAEDWFFEVRSPGKRKETLVKEYRFHPRLELFADIGRKLDFSLPGGRELTHMTFTRRDEKRSIAKATAVSHKDVFADVEIKISAKQGPDDAGDRRAWLQAIRDSFETQGYESKLYFRNLGGGILGGEVHRDLAGATDLVMCPKELISLSKQPRDWYPRINAEVSERMIELLNRDELWERGK